MTMSKRKDRERAESGNPFRNISEKVIKKVNKLSEKLVGIKLENASFDRKALAARRLIKMAGVPKMRASIIEAAEMDIEDCIEQGMTDEEILQPCLDSPNYMKLLEELDLSLDHIKVIIKEARK